MTAAGYAQPTTAARAQALFGRVMALVALMVGCATLAVTRTDINPGSTTWPARMKQ
jgi:hypothetical protein